MIRPITTRYAAGLFLLLLVPAASTIAQTLTIENTRDLSFGSFVAGAGGSVTISVDDGRTANGSVILLPSASGNAAQFAVSGTGEATYNIDLPADGSVVLSEAGGANMTLSNFTSSPSGAGGVLSTAGFELLSVGATLNVGAGQPAGQYSGSYTVYVNYN